MRCLFTPYYVTSSQVFIRDTTDTALQVNSSACNRAVSNDCRKTNIKVIRAVFKWLSKVIIWLRLLRLVIGLKDSRQFFNQWEAKRKAIPPCTRDFSRSLSELQEIARNSDWFTALFAPVVIGRVRKDQVNISTSFWGEWGEGNM